MIPMKWQRNTGLWSRMQCCGQGLRCAWQDPSLAYVLVLGGVLSSTFFLLAPSLLAKALCVYVATAPTTVEIINTTFERTMDRVSKDWHPLTRDVKDMAAGASGYSQVVALLVLALAGRGVQLAWQSFFLLHPDTSWFNYIAATFSH